MRIENNPFGPRIDPRQGPQSLHESAPRSEASREVSQGANAYSPAPELADLAAKLRDVVEIRESVVQAAAARLAAGAFFSRSAAEKTAEAILDS